MDTGSESEMVERPKGQKRIVTTNTLYQIVEESDSFELPMPPRNDIDYDTHIRKKETGEDKSNVGVKLSDDDGDEDMGGQT